jgi:site-specific recombinase XerD
MSARAQRRTASVEAKPKEKSKVIRLPNGKGGGGGRIGVAQEIEEFLLDRQARNVTSSTLAWYRRCLGCWREYLVELEVCTTAQVTPSTVRRFLVHLADRGHTPGGVVTLFTGVKAFLNWYREEHALAEWKPLARIENPKRPKDPLPPVSLAVVQAMIATCEAGAFNGDRDQALLLLLLDTGVRHQELVNLLVGQVNLETGSVLVRQGKGRKTRTVFCGETTRQALANYLAHRTRMAAHDPLWVKEDGGRLAGRVKELEERYAESLPNLEVAVADLKVKVDSHRKRMGVSWV